MPGSDYAALTGVAGGVVPAGAGGVYSNSSSAPNSVSSTFERSFSLLTRARPAASVRIKMRRPMRRLLRALRLGASVNAIDASRTASSASRTSLCSFLSSSIALAGALPLLRRPYALLLDSIAFCTLSRRWPSSIRRWMYGLDLAMLATSAGLKGTAALAFLRLDGIDLPRVRGRVGFQNKPSERARVRSGPVTNDRELQRPRPSCHAECRRRERHGVGTGRERLAADTPREGQPVAASHAVAPDRPIADDTAA